MKHSIERYGSSVPAQKGPKVTRQTIENTVLFLACQRIVRVQTCHSPGTSVLEPNPDVRWKKSHERKDVRESRRDQLLTITTGDNVVLDSRV